MSNLSLTVFSSTLGHHGFKHQIDESMINDLKKKIDLSYFSVRVCHIKDSGEGNFQDLVDLYEKNGFLVFSSEGEWSHYNVSHQKEYTKDMIKMYSENRNIYRYSDFNLHLENDWCFMPQKPYNLEMCFARAMAALNQNLDKLTVRFPNSDDELTRLNNVKNIHRHLHWIRGEKYNDELICYDENFSQNPHIDRTRDLFSTVDIIKNHFDKYSQHVEHEYSKAVKLLTHSELPFLCFDPSIIRLLHLGEKNYPELLVKLEELNKQLQSR